MITYPDLIQFCTFIPASNEPSGHACMSIWRLPRGQITSCGKWQDIICIVLLLVDHNYAIIMIKKGVKRMPLIMPIKDLRNTTEISNIAHKVQEPIFITKNGYSDLVVMSSELYDKFARMNCIDQAIFESEQEIANGAEAVDAEIVFAELEKRHFG